jgi:hypothetical protein
MVAHAWFLILYPGVFVGIGWLARFHRWLHRRS